LEEILKAGTDDSTYIEKYMNEIDELLKKVDDLTKNGQVSKAILATSIEKSAWWLAHPSGPVRAPKHAERIKGPETRRVLEYGANTFNVSEAFLLCMKEMKAFLQSNRTTPNFDKQFLPKLRQKLDDAVCRSVYSSAGCRYTKYPMDENKMIFGTQAINVKEFVDYVLEIIPIDRFIMKNIQKQIQEGNQTKLKFSKRMTKHYNKVLLAKNMADQVESAMCTLQCANELLRVQQKIKWKSVFFALTETVQRNHGDLGYLNSLLSRLLSRQQESVKKTKNPVPIQKINSQLREILEIAGFEPPG
jgi:hypothetical protein